MTLGNWNLADPTTAAIRDGWMHSGDLATIDEQGRVRIVGQITDRLGERVCARVRTRATVDPDTIIAWCGRLVAHYKVPSQVHVVDAFPMTLTGKIQKFVMRDAETQAR